MKYIDTAFLSFIWLAPFAALAFVIGFPIYWVKTSRDADQIHHQIARGRLTKALVTSGITTVVFVGYSIALGLDQGAGTPFSFLYMTFLAMAPFVALAIMIGGCIHGVNISLKPDRSIRKILQSRLMIAWLVSGITAAIFVGVSIFAHPTAVKNRSLAVMVGSGLFAILFPLYLSINYFLKSEHRHILLQLLLGLLLSVLFGLIFKTPIVIIDY